MRKRVIIFLILAFILAGCADSKNESSMDEGSKAVTNNNEKIYSEPLPPEEDEELSASYDFDYSLENIINASSNIILCEIDGQRKFEKGTEIFSVSIIDELKGNIGSGNIEIYADEEFLEGNQYVIFLEYFDSALYGGRVYKPLAHATVNEGEITGYYSLFSKLIDLGIDPNDVDDEKELMKYIKKVDDGKKTNSPNTSSIIIETDDIDTLAVESDYICEIVPVLEIASNPVVKYMQCDVTKNYKGKIKDTISVFLPKTASIDEEYLVFLTKTDDDVYEVNSSISFISKKEEKEYTKALESVLK